MPLGGLIAAGVLAAAGVAKSEFSDKPRAEKKRALAAETARYSPWTGMTPESVQEADPLGSGLQGAMTGAALGQSISNASSARKFQDAQAGYLNRGGGGGAIWAGMPGGADAYSGGGMGMGGTSRYPSGFSWNKKGLMD